jgi:hypothetical protein
MFDLGIVDVDSESTEVRRLKQEKAQLQVLVDGLTKIIEEFCKDEVERRSHLCWWDGDEIVSFTNQ